MIAKQEFQTKIYQDGGYTYICKANVGSDNTVDKPVWQIVRIDSTGSKSYANSDTEFNKIAQNYASYSY